MITTLLCSAERVGADLHARAWDGESLSWVRSLVFGILSFALKRAMEGGMLVMVCVMVVAVVIVVIVVVVVVIVVVGLTYVGDAEHILSFDV
jgi:hypothetical protein